MTRRLKSNDNRLPANAPIIKAAEHDALCPETNNAIKKGELAAFFPLSGRYYHKDGDVYKSICPVEKSHDRS